MFLSRLSSPQNCHVMPGSCTGSSSVQEQGFPAHVCWCLPAINNPCYNMRMKRTHDDVNIRICMFYVSGFDSDPCSETRARHLTRLREQTQHILLFEKSYIHLIAGAIECMLRLHGFWLNMRTAYQGIGMSVLSLCSGVPPPPGPGMADEPPVPHNNSMVVSRTAARHLDFAASQGSIAGAQSSGPFSSPVTTPRCCSGLVDAIILCCSSGMLFVEL